MKYTLRILCIAITSLLLIGSMAGCSIIDRFTEKPDTEVVFHDLKLSIPFAYIIDSTQSDTNFRVYEKGWYKSVILLSRNTVDDDIDELLNGYVEYILESGGSSQRTTFLDQPAVRSTFTSQDGKNAEEMLFIYNGYCYAISMRDGTEQEFQDLLSTVVLSDEAVAV